MSHRAIAAAFVICTSALLAKADMDQGALNVH